MSRRSAVFSGCLGPLGRQTDGMSLGGLLRCLGLSSLGALAACRAPQVEDADQPWDRDRPRGRFGDRVVAEASVMPAFWMRFDRDDDDPAARSLDTVGPGWTTRVGLGNVDQSIGLLYQGAFTEEEDGDAEVDVHALYLDFDASIPVEPDPELMLVRAAAGVGMVHLDSPDRTLDTTTGAVNLRLQLELRPTRVLAFMVGGGGFAFGRPGESVAFGTFVDLGLRVTF